MKLKSLFEKIEFPFIGENRNISSEIRNYTGGKFIKLDDGLTHYDLQGPENGEVVILVHGFSVNYHIWDKNIDFLIQKGFRVLRYDLYGRGFSERPIRPYEITLFTNQLLQLIEILKLKKPLTLVGNSMGGYISVSFTSKHGEYVKNLILIDPSGMKQKVGRQRKILQIPLLGELLFLFKGTKMMIQGMRKGPHAEEIKNEIEKEFIHQMKYKGYKRAILSTMRNKMLDDEEDTGRHADVYAQVGKSSVPVLLLWGTEDVTTPFSQSGNIKHLIPHLVFKPIEGIGHVPHYEAPDMINPVICSFIESNKI